MNKKQFEKTWNAIENKVKAIYIDHNFKSVVIVYANNYRYKKLINGNKVIYALWDNVVIAEINIKDISFIV